MNKRYLKVMFGTTSGADKNLEYKIGEVNIANNWNPNATNPQEIGGFNFSVETKILRWLVRGDTIYDVTIPEDSQIIDCSGSSCPGGVFRSDKIIISNPRVITDEMAMNLYLKSDLPEKSYFKAMAGCAIRGHIHTVKQIIKDKVNKQNINVVLEEIKDFVNPKNATQGGNIETYNEMMRILEIYK